jgi:hypothetical protein
MPAIPHGHDRFGGKNMASLHFDLYQDTVFPYAPSPSNYLNSWTRKITVADGAAWTGLFDSSAGDKSFNTLAFGSTARTGTNALVVDWNPAGDGVTISTGLRWNDIKNIHLDNFDGASLSLRNFVDVLVALGANTAGQSVSVDGAKRGKIDLGSGADTLFVGVDSNSGSSGANDFYINTGAGADSVRIARSTIDYSITAFRDNYSERWTNTQVRLGAGNDGIVADGSNDTVWGGADNDTAELRGGINWFDGEAGFDKAVFRGLKADYLIEAVSGGYKVTDLRTGVDGDDGVTTVINAEQLVFKDQVVSIGGNQAPDAVNDTYTMRPGETLSVAIPGVLGNDTDADGDALVVTLISDAPDHGSIALFPDGHFTYTPTPGFVGTDSFVYQITDGFGGFDSATVTINVLNAAPDAVDDFYTTRPGQALSIAVPGVLGNDSDADGDALVVTLISDAPDHGSIALFPDGHFTYTPVAGYVGTDSFVYQITDGFGGFDSATVTITMANATPDAVDDTYNMRPGETLSVAIPGVLGNDSDPDGDALVVTLISDAPDHGTIVLFPDGHFSYTPAPGFAGTDSFVYQITDGFGGFDSATVTINVLNAAPDAVDDFYTTRPGQAVSISVPGVLGNDSDPDGDALVVTLISDAPDHGAISLFPDGHFTYTPTPGYVGTDSFVYQITDGFGGFDSATVTITMLNAAPDAVDDTYTMRPGETLSVAIPGVLGNDSDPDGDALVVTLISDAPDHGSIVLFPDGHFTYTPVAGYVGTDSFVYQITDGFGGFDSATVTITMANAAPDAVNDTYTMRPGETLSVAIPGVLGNDTDADGDALVVTLISDAPDHGTILLFPDGHFTYTPVAGYVGTDSFVYQITDGFGGFDSATVTITMANAAPDAVNDTYTMRPGETLSVAIPGVLGNDTDADGDALVVTLISDAPDHGTIVLFPDGHFTYTPVAGYVGTDSFVYVISDGFGGSDSATVTISVGGANLPPIANDDTFTTFEDLATPLQIPVLFNDSDPEGGPLAVISFTQGAHGTVAFGANLSYVPTDPNYNGTDSFTYTIIDDQGLTATATVTVTILPTNDPVVAVDDVVVIAEDAAPIFISPLANDTDIDGDVLTLLSITQAAHGTVQQNGNQVLYFPDPDYNGPDQFTYQVFDQGGVIDVGTVFITVTPVNDAPVANDDSFTTTGPLVLPLSTFVGTLLANDTDIDGDQVFFGQFFQPAHGTLVQVGTTVTYTPDAGFVGQDSFTYTVFDVNGGAASATATITVQAPGNNPPVALGEAFLGTEDTPFSGNLALNDSDPDGDTLTYTQLGAPLPGLALAADGSFTYTPPANLNGLVSFDYQVSDGNGGTATASALISLEAVNDAPTPQPDGNPAIPFATGTEDTPLVFTLASILANDTHPDGAAALAGTAFENILVSGFGIGSVAVIGGTVTVTPIANFSGGTFFTYAVLDAQNDVGSTNVYVNFTPVNDAPVASDDAFARAATPTQTITRVQLITNDSDADNTNSNPADDQVLAITSVSAISGGTVVLNADQSVTVTFTGGPVQFQYTLSDGVVSNTATVTLNEPPVAVDDAITIAEDIGWSNYHYVSVLANDTDPNGDPLSIVAVNTAGTPIVADWVGNQARFYVNDPSGNTNGVFEIGYTVSDGLGTDTGTITITVTPENDGPRDPQGTDAALNLTTAEDTPLVISVAALLADDTNPPDEVQFAQLFDLQNWLGGGGSVVNNGNGTLTFTPSTDFNGNTGFFYRAADEQGAVGGAVWVPVAVTPVNDPLVANDDIIAREFQGGGAQTITRAQLLGNDADPDSDGVITAASIVSGISSLVLNPDQSVTVTYAAGQLPVFTYTLSDVPNGGTSTDTATVTLNSGPQVTGTPGTLVWTEDVRNYIYDTDLITLAGITDPNGDPLQIVDFQSGSHFGVDDPFWDSFALLYNYAYFQPFPADYNGATTLTFTVSDGNAATDLTITINVIVQAVNDAPKDSSQYSPGYVGGNDGTDGGFVTTEGTAITILKSALLADDDDPEGDAFSIVGFGNNSGIGTVVDNGDSYTFTPYSFYANFVGETPGFYYTLRDAQGATSYHYVFIEFTNTPDPITANDDVVQRAAGTSQTISATTILANDVDPDPGDTKTIIDVVAVNGLDAVSIDGNGDVVVQYAAVGTGRASFTYTAQDSTGNTDTATVALNRAPVATGEGPITMSEGPDYLFIPYSTLLANDTDADGDALSVYLYNWGYQGSNVFVKYDTQGGIGGLRVTLYQDEYTGPAEFQYYVYDGSAYSDFVTVTLNVIAGDDVPKANPDYWYNNGAQYNDVNPATNDMVGIEDQVLEFPVSRLTEGQFISGTYQTGADENDDGTLAQLTIASIFSPYGAVEIVDIGGVDHVRFTPYADVNSAYPYSQGALDWSRIYLTYSVDDGTTVSNTTQAYLLILPVNDVPVAGDDSFTVIGDGPYTLDIGQAGGQFDVRANDTSPDNYPYSIYDYSSLANVVAISGGSASFNGYSVTFTPDGSGDPMVFEYTLLDADGDSDTAQVTLNALPAAPQAFYFSGAVPAYGRELWVYDPASFDPGLGGAFATMVDAAETAPGTDNGTPHEITALADSVFWRDEYYQSWHTYNPALGWQQLSSVNTSAFDTALAEADRNLGIRSGDYFWGATQGEGATLTAWDQAGNYETQIFLSGFDRSLLTDAGHDPAYVGLVSTYDPVTDTSNDAEQVHAVLWGPGFNGFGNYQLTDGGDTSNDVTEIAGLQVVQNPNNSGEYAKTIYFTGDFTDGNGDFHANALWRITTTNDGFNWTSNQAPEFLDNGSGGGVQANAHALLVTDAPYAGATVERLFWLQNDAAGNGQIATRYDDHFGGFSTSTANNYLGFAFQGFEIRPWENGVLFSGSVPGLFGGAPGAVIASYTDADGDGFFDVTTYWNALSDGVIEQLVVDGQGNAAWVLDTGGFDYLYVYREAFGSTDFVASRVGEITDVQLAGGHLVYRSEDSSGTFDTLHDFALDVSTVLEVPTDEPTGGGAGDGFTSSYANVALAGGLAFEATNGSDYSLWTTDGTNVFSPASLLFRFSEGAALDGDWVGTAYRNDTAELGLVRVDATGNATTLFVNGIGSVSNEAEVLGEKVLFGSTANATNSVVVYDDTTGTTSTLLANHLLGAASTVGSGIVFDALNFATSTWDLYRYDGTTAELLASLPAGGGGGQPVYEWWRHQDFLGNDSRVFWQQISDVTGLELHTIDLTAADPASTLTVVDISPGLGQGAGFADAIFANGRIYWQASPAGNGGTIDMRLYTTVDGTTVTEVTGPQLYDAGEQNPYQPVAIGNDVFFLGRTTVNDTWGVFQIDDAAPTTATLISNPGLGALSGLAAIGSDLYFFGDDAGGVQQLLRQTPGGLPIVAVLTGFTTDNGTDMSDLFQADGQIFFSRSEPGLARELWVLDSNDPTGARLVADINTQSSDGYAPEQVVAVPDPLEQYLAGTFQPFGGGGTLI